MRAEMRHYRAHCTAAHDARDARRAAARVRVAARRRARARRLGRRAPAVRSPMRSPSAPTTTPLPALAGARGRGHARSPWSPTGTSRCTTCSRASASRRHFAVVVTAAAVGAAKPDARPFRVALERLGVEAAACVHVGDDPVTDVAGARAAGLARAAARPQRARARTRSPTSRSSPRALGGGGMTPPVARDPVAARPGYAPAGRRGRRARHLARARHRAGRARAAQRRRHLLARPRCC